MLVNAIYNIVDRMFIGNAPELGAIGLAGISICYPVTLVLMAISLMIGMGGATRFSIALGQGKKEEAGKYMGNGGQWMNALVTKQLIPLPNTPHYLLAQDKLVRIQPMDILPLWNKSNQMAPILISESTSRA